MKYRLLLAVLVLAPSAVMAEDDALSRNITVERDYNPSTVDAVKISPIPSKEDLNVEKPDVKYSTNTQPQDVVLTNDLVKADYYDDDLTEDYKNGVAKVGLGFYWQTLAEFYYPMIKTDQYLFDIDLKHIGNFGRRSLADGTTPRAMEHNTALKLNFEDQLTEMTLFANARVSYNGFDYYGYQDSLGVPTELHTDTLLRGKTGSYTDVKAKFGLFSTNPYSNLEYKFDIGYQYFGRNFSVQEHSILTNLDLGGEVGPGKLGAEIEAELEFFNQGSGNQSDALIKLKPYYTFGGKRWNLRLGGDMNIHIEKDSNRPFTGSANILGNFALVPERLYLNTGIGGYFNENMYSEIIKENKWINPLLVVEPTYSPLDINVGIKTNIIKGLMFDAGVRYTLILDQYYYVNDTLPSGITLNTFHTVYDNTNKVTAELGLYFNYVKGLDISLKGKYNYWGTVNLERAWQKPAWEVNFDASYLIKEKWRIGLSYNFLGGRYALIGGKAVKMNNVHDLNLYFSYQVLDFLEIFATGKNLINITSDSYYGYTTMGINAMIGATFRF